MTTAASKQTAPSRIKRTSTVFIIFNVIIMAILVFITIYPFYYVIVGSISGNNVGAQEVYFLYPVDLDFGAYNMVFSTTSIPRAYMNTVFVTVVGTILSLLLTILTAYPLSKSRLRGRSFFTMLFYFTMLFSGGLIPTYLVIRDLGMIDSLWSLILPRLVSVYNMLLMINYFKSIPDGLEESATIDGANDLKILVRIILPLSMPILATLTLFYAVSYWNIWFDAIMYLNSNRYFPLQLVLRDIVQSVDMTYVGGGGGDFTMSDTTIQAVRLATIVVAILPIMMVYPFLQKYFVKGVMIGAIKG